MNSCRARDEHAPGHIVTTMAAVEVDPWLARVPSKAVREAGGEVTILRAPGKTRSEAEKVVERLDSLGVFFRTIVFEG
jgi:hypothetical protein